MTLNEMITIEEFLDQPVFIKIAAGREHLYLISLKQILQPQHLKNYPLNYLCVLSQKDKEFLELITLVELGIPPSDRIKVGRPYFPYTPYLKKSLGN